MMLAPIRSGPLLTVTSWSKLTHPTWNSGNVQYLSSTSGDSSNSSTSTPTNGGSRAGKGLLKSVLFGNQTDTSSHDSRGDAARVMQSSDAIPAGTGVGERTTHSKRLARGKYVHEISWHQVKPECMVEYRQLMQVVLSCALPSDPLFIVIAYVNICSHMYPSLVTGHDCSQHYYPLLVGTDSASVAADWVGSWRTLIGAEDECVHVWGYDGYSGYHQARMHWQQHSTAYRDLQHRLPALLASRKNAICLEFSFWPTHPPQQLGGVYELRSYHLKPGNLLEWETHWKKGLQCRSQFCQPVGAWFTQLGPLHTVHHMWNYPDLETRKLTREAAWQVNGWAETVWNTVPLMQSMQTCILEPLPRSPLG